jgi:hypothetical protein
VFAAGDPGSRDEMVKTTTTTTQGSLLQRWLQLLTSARSDATRAKLADVRTYAAVISAGQERTAWDPHEVWLDRIKKPRDDRRAAALEPETTVHAVEESLKESR